MPTTLLGGHMLEVNRRIRRRLSASIHSSGRRRSVILELSPGGDGTPGPGFLGFRLEKTRTIYWLPADWCWRQAVICEMARRKIERKKARAKKE